MEPMRRGPPATECGNRHGFLSLGVARCSLGPETVAVPLRKSRDVALSVLRNSRDALSLAGLLVHPRRRPSSRETIAVLAKENERLHQVVFMHNSRLTYLRGRLSVAEKASRNYPQALAVVTWVQGNDNAHGNAYWMPNCVARTEEELIAMLSGNMTYDYETQQRAAKLDPEAFFDDSVMTGDLWRRRRAALAKARISPPTESRAQP
jgi:hypothetical protein